MNTIKKNSDFRKVYNKKKSFANKQLVIYYDENNLEYSRLGISISKKIGNAVTRNKIRRKLKEIYRLNENKIALSYDIILIVRVSAKECKYDTLEKSFFHLLKKNNLYVEKG